MVWKNADRARKLTTGRIMSLPVSAEAPCAQGKVTEPDYRCHPEITKKNKVNIPSDGNPVGRRSPSVCPEPGGLGQSPAGCPPE